MDPSHQAFENDVRRVARQIWPESRGQAINLAKHELDGLFAIREFHVFVDATTSRRKAEVETKLRTLTQIVKSVRRQNFQITGYIVTKDDPTADQMDCLDDNIHNGINIISFKQLQAKVIDGQEYIQCRNNYRFGSVQNLVRKEINVPRSAFVEPLIDDGVLIHSTIDILNDVKKSRRFFIVSEFGTGKSMLLRELYYKLADGYKESHEYRFPVYINMGDHSGAQYPDEVLERHGRIIGFPQPSQLVRAWRAGFVDLLLDGFDEIGGSTWNLEPSNVVRQRERGLAAFKLLVAESPNTAGICIAGRVGYFNDDNERGRAFGTQRAPTKAQVAPLRFIDLYVREFDPPRIATLLKKRNITSDIPNFIPRRPAFLTYLIDKGYFDRLDSENVNVSRGDAWNQLLAVTASRESTQREGTLDPASVRHLMEALATRSRCNTSGNMVLDTLQIREAFALVARRDPDERDRELIDRLPGLGPAAGAEQFRKFVDEDLRLAASAGDLIRFILDRDQFSKAQMETLSRTVEPISGLTSDVVVAALLRMNVSLSQVSVAAEYAVKIGLNQTVADLVYIMLNNDIKFHTNSLIVQKASLRDIDISALQTKSFSGISFSECFIDSLCLPNTQDFDNCPSFHDCIINFGYGSVEPSNLPSDKFHGVSFENFDFSTKRNAAILQSDLSYETKALLTILHKLFLQPGSGRVEHAFYSGVPAEVAQCVRKVLPIIRRYEFASESTSRKQTIWLPARDKTQRVHRIFEQLAASDDELFIAVNSH